MAEQPVPELPPSMALAWGLADRPGRGPKRALTIAQVVQAGIAVAVEDGLSAVSMARVAQRVGASTMALYRYVRSKDDLLELMVDTALGAPPPAVPGESWRAGLLRWARGVRDAYRTHPWTLRVPISAPPLGPNNIAWLENGLAALAGTRLATQQKMSSLLLISGYVRSEELLLQDLAAAYATGRDAAYPAQLAQVVDEVRYPQIWAALAAGALNDDDGLDGVDGDGIDGEFEFGVARILDGVDALIRKRRPRR